jgi:hypothetical protein
MEAAYSLWAIVHGMAILQITSLQGFPIEFSTADRTALEAFVKGLGI